MKKIFYLIAVAGVLLNSCRDADLNPTLAQSKDLTQSLNSDADLKVYMNGVYSIMRDYNYLGRDYIIFNEVRSDNAYANGNSNRFVNEAAFNVNATDSNPGSTWYRIYQAIGRSNVVINRVPTSFTGNQSSINHMIGEAYIIRAMAHFDLVRLFGQQYVSGQGGMKSLGVPYVKVFKGDPSNLFPKRNTVQEDYDNALADLNAAIALMDASQDDTSTKNYMTSYAAWALMSRMAIYFGDYATAEKAAKKVIDAGKYSIISSANYVNSWKSKGSANWIFAIASNTSNEALSINSLAYIYRLPASGSGYGDIVALGNLKKIYDSGDVRASSAMMSATSGSGDGEFRNLGKFVDTQNGGDDIPVIRYEEVILNYAEALLNNGNAADALTYLNMLPANRSANPYTVANMTNILLERRKEFAFEGMIFHDIARTAQGVPLIDNSRQSFKSSIPAGDYRFSFPIPNTELGANANIVQNYNYN